jgi:hypothetical protein
LPCNSLASDMSPRGGLLAAPAGTGAARPFNEGSGFIFPNVLDIVTRLLTASPAGT